MAVHYWERTVDEAEDSANGGSHSSAWGRLCDKLLFFSLSNKIERSIYVNGVPALRPHPTNCKLTVSEEGSDCSPQLDCQQKCGPSNERDPLTRASGLFPRAGVLLERRGVRGIGVATSGKEGAVHTGCHFRCWDTAINECARASSFRAHFLECPFVFFSSGSEKKNAKLCCPSLCSCFSSFLPHPGMRDLLYIHYTYYIYIGEV